MSRPTFPVWERAPVSHLIRLAARHAPADLTSRLEEEWLADLSERDGIRDRWRLALGCAWAALAIRCEHRVPEAAVPSPPAAPLVRAYAARGAFRMNAQKSPPSSQVLCDINTTPLIDVLLVLLITLILSLPVMTHAVKLDLPQGTPPVKRPPEVIDLDIDFDGTVAWNGTSVSFERLENYFSTEAARTEQPEIHLRADRRARYDVVARVLASAQRHGMQRIGFVDTASFKDE